MLKQRWFPGVNRLNSNQTVIWRVSKRYFLDDTLLACFIKVDKMFQLLSQKLKLSGPRLMNTCFASRHFPSLICTDRAGLSLRLTEVVVPSGRLPEGHFSPSNTSSCPAP